MSKKLTPEQIKFAEDNMKLVSAVLRNKVNRKDRNYQDLYQVGYFGLCKAVLGFDKNKHCEFSTYATKIITRSINNYMMKEAKYEKHESGYIDNVYQDLTGDEETELSALDKITGNKSDISTDFEAAELKIVIENAFEGKNLSDNQIRKILAFIYRTRGLSCEECGRLVGAPEGVGRNWVCLGKKMLKKNGKLMEAYNEQ